MARNAPINQLDRYIVRQLLAALVAVTTALVALIWLTQSLRFVELVVNRGLSLRVFVQLTSLLIPNFVAVILPITTFVVTQFVYQRLSGDRELTVMRSAGLSPWALSRPAMMAALIAMAASFWLNIWVVPASNTAFKEYQFELRNKVAAFLLQEGVFTAISDQLTVYVRSRDTDGTLRGIMVEDDRQSNTRATILAESGRLIAAGDTPQVLLENGSRQEIDAKTGRLDVLTFAEDTVVSVLTGSFRRAGNLWRPLAAVLAMVGLLAVGLTAQSVAARHPVLVPLIWAQAVLPGLVCAWVLFAPAVRSGLRHRVARRGTARAVRPA